MTQEAGVRSEVVPEAVDVDVPHISAAPAPAAPIDLDDPSLYVNRELSWLDFNMRVLEEAYDEHLEIKKLILDAMSSTDEPGFDGKVAALKGAVEHHVEEEEGELFPKVTKLLGKDAEGEGVFP